MQTQNLQVDAVSTINYQFTAIPTNLFYLLDNNSRTILFTLIQSSSYYAKEDGFFYITKEAIGELTNLSVNVITAAIDTLYINNLVQVTTVGKSKGKYVNHYKVNFEEFIKFEDMTFEDLKNPLNKIESVKYKNNYQPQYIKDYLCNQVCKQERKQERKKVITNIDNIDNINNIENKDNIKNKNNINKEINNINIYTSNILEDNSEEIEVIETSISENDKEENNLNIKEVGFVDNPTSDKIEEIETTPTMTAKFEKNLNLLLDKLNLCASIEELEDKVVKLCNWIETCNASYTSTELDSIKEKIASTYSINKDRFEEMETSIEDDFFNNKEEKEATTPSKTKEQFIADLEEYKNTIINQDNLEDAKQQFKMFCNLKDKEIREFELIPMVADIIMELDAQINSNNTFLTTFNLQDTESITEANKTQENALNSLRSISYVVDDTEDYPF